MWMYFDNTGSKPKWLVKGSSPLQLRTLTSLKRKWWCVYGEIWKNWSALRCCSWTVTADICAHEPCRMDQYFAVIMPRGPIHRRHCIETSPINSSTVIQGYKSQRLLNKKARNWSGKPCLFGLWRRPGFIRIPPVSVDVAFPCGANLNNGEEVKIRLSSYFDDQFSAFVDMSICSLCERWQRVIDTNGACILDWAVV